MKIDCGEQTSDKTKSKVTNIFNKYFLNKWLVLFSCQVVYICMIFMYCSDRIQYYDWNRRRPYVYTPLQGGNDLGS